MISSDFLPRLQGLRTAIESQTFFKYNFSLEVRMNLDSVVVSPKHQYCRPKHQTVTGNK